MDNQHTYDLFSQPAYVPKKVDVQPNVDFTHKIDRNPETYFPSVKVFNGHARSIYDWMMNGEKITAKTVYERLGTLKGSTRISDCRKKGVLFSSKELETEEGVRYYEYSMSPEQIEQNKTRFSINP